MKPNEKMVITTLKTTEHGIQVTTRWIDRSGGAEKNATINDYVTKIDTFSSKVIDLHYFFLKEEEFLLLLNGIVSPITYLLYSQT